MGHHTLAKRLAASWSSPRSSRDVALEVLVDHRRLVAAGGVTDVRGDLVALGHLPVVRGADLVLGEGFCSSLIITHEGATGGLRVRVRVAQLAAVGGSTSHGHQYGYESPMSVVIGVLLGAGLATAIGIGWAVIHAARAARTPAAIGWSRRSTRPPHVAPTCRGLSPSSAEQAVRTLRRLTGAASVPSPTRGRCWPSTARAAGRSVPAMCSARPLEGTRDDRARIEPDSPHRARACPLRSAVLVPPLVQGRRAGTLIPFTGDRESAAQRDARGHGGGQPGLGTARAVVVAEQEERLRRAELRRCAPRSRRTSSTTRWRPSPVISTLAPTTRASSSSISPSSPPTCSATVACTSPPRSSTMSSATCASSRPVPLAPRPGRRGAETLGAVVPAMSASRCGECRPSSHRTRRGHGPSGGTGPVVGEDVELRVFDDGSGIDPERLPGCWPARARHQLSKSTAV